MSGGNNNFTPNSRTRQAGHGYGDYAPNGNDRSRRQAPFPLPFLADPDASRGAPYHGPLFERMISRPFDLAGFLVPPNSPMQVLGREVNPSHRQIIQESAPAFMRQQNVQVPTHEDDSRLTQDEQQTALKKLKKGIYNPPPKKMPWPPLYYRVDTKEIHRRMEKAKEDEGVNCAVCLEDFEPREAVMLTPCNHMFHEVCIVPWVRSHGQCPVCRFSLGEQKKENASANNRMNVARNDQFAAELISVIRALDEGSIWDNVASLYQL